MDPAERNMQDALTLAKMLFDVVKSPEFVKLDPEQRNNILIKRYPNFAKAYPVILRLMSRDIKYNEKAFKRYLNKLITDPGKGMDGFIERQADYAKFLYIEDNIKNNKHWSIKQANKIWNIEYDGMRRSVKKLEKEEKEAKNEFSEEKKKNLDLRREELFKFLYGNIDIKPEYEPSKPEAGKSLFDVDPNKLKLSELIQYIRQLRELKFKPDNFPEVPEFHNIVDLLKAESKGPEYQAYVDYSIKLKQNILKLEEQEKNKKSKIVDPEWLKGTSAF